MTDSGPKSGRTASGPSGWSVAASRLEAGVWTLRLEGGKGAPKIEVVHRHRPLDGVETSSEAGATVVTVPLPVEILTEGASSVHAVEKGSGTVLASLTISAGAPVSEDLVDEIALIRDELELVKRVIRRRFSD